MVFTKDLIESLTHLVKASEELLSLASEDESRAEMWSEELDTLEEQCNYARGVLLAAGHPIKP